MNQSSSDSVEHLLLNMAPVVVLFFIVGIIAFVFIIAYMIRLWLVQSATFQIQKDVAEIRDHILGLSIKESHSDSTMPNVGNFIKPLSVKKNAEFKRPRPLFVWIAGTIPVLVIGLVILLNLSE